MKIWIDFINTPQVSFWLPFIEEFKNENHKVILTCRDSGNTIDLLKKQRLDFQVIGEQVGKGSLMKMLLFPKRLINLFTFISKNHPDIAASQSSFYQPMVAYALGIPCLYTNDNEHAKGNLFGFVFAKKVVLPIALSKMGFTKMWPLKLKLSFYPSVKEAIYLAQYPGLQNQNSERRNIIYFRPEPWSAQYYEGPLNFFDETLLLLANDYRVTILPRDKNQLNHYSQEKFARVSVVQKPIDLKDIVADCMLFIGAGGSMTRELAVLGIPVISIYQSKMLCVDKYLIDKGQMKAIPDITYKEIRDILRTEINLKTDSSVLKEGLVSYQMIKNSIMNLKP